MTWQAGHAGPRLPEVVAIGCRLRHIQELWSCFATGLANESQVVDVHSIQDCRRTQSPEPPSREQASTTVNENLLRLRSQLGRGWRSPQLLAGLRAPRKGPGFSEAPPWLMGLFVSEFRLRGLSPAITLDALGRTHCTFEVSLFPPLHAPICLAGARGPAEG